MTSSVGQFMLAALLLLAGAGVWTAAGHDRSLAEAASDLAGLQYDTAAALASEQSGTPLLPRLPGVEDSAGRARAIGDTARYWQGTLTADRAAKPTLLSANAAYHAAVQSGGKGPAVIARLDDVVKQYAEVVREQPENEDAAFNYEFVVRLRTAIAASKRDVPPMADENEVTLHGLPGAPPAGADTKTFKMIVPMQPDERREAEQAGRGAPRNRKG